MSGINCHSGTKKEELIAFVGKHKGKMINIHYENNMSDSWGDDDDYTYDTNIEKQYKEIINVINTHYIHSIKINFVE